MSNISAWQDNINVTSAISTIAPPQDPQSHVVVYILIPLGSLFFVILLAIVAVILLRRSKMEKLRHHLMPMYSFDPADEDEDWESELLEDQDKEQQSPSPTGSSQRYNFSLNRR
ncbi:small integral membrane protein 29-like isoform X2 [Ylistrum balloti]|uniref:small integral membrane protein 29-like isoform X2 n=1 Tax=Ylistrum balloti TaxID=509963 RepID=UPI002905B2FE|nr:small integral membrane protein 29-like isoform X2 [Ylistrum balloti]